MFIPSHIQIEVVSGYCSAHCNMCTIDNWTRPKGIMPNDIYIY